jgi:hypothetical protein
MLAAVLATSRPPPQRAVQSRAVSARQDSLRAKRRQVVSNSIRHRGIGSSLRQGRRLCYSQSSVCYRGGQESTNGERRGEKAEGGGMRLCFLPVILLASTIALAAGKDAPITEQELVQRTQELYDAVAAGNQAPWKQYFADDCIFSDEKGRTMDKSKLVADITPLPTGYSGVIKLEHVQSRIYDEVAILSYDANEAETIFGQKLSARYHITDTWLRRDGTWQIVASQAHRYYEDPAVGKADPKKFADFIGTYELASGQTRTVLSEGDSLFVERNGKKDQLLPETSDLFFRKGIEGRILFRYDKGGKVDALIDRRNNEDVVWRKKS